MKAHAGGFPGIVRSSCVSAASIHTPGSVRALQARVLRPDRETKKRVREREEAGRLRRRGGCFKIPPLYGCRIINTPGLHINMHLLGISLLLAYLLYSNLASDYYEDYEQEQMDEPVSPRCARCLSGLHTAVRSRSCSRNRSCFSS